MKILLSQDEIQKAIVQYIKETTQFKVEESDVILKEEWDGKYGNESEIIGFSARILMLAAGHPYGIIKPNAKHG